MVPTYFFITMDESYYNRGYQVVFPKVLTLHISVGKVVENGTPPPMFLPVVVIIILFIFAGVMSITC